ncbi:PXA domain-containing protein [Trametes meyenii]|nr:PXA domain-containing protein [Trametes meyenii]
MPPSGRHAVLLFLAVGVGLPALKRVLSSPVTLALLLPLLVLLLVLGFFVVNVAFGYFLDSIRPAPRNSLASAARPLAFSTPAAWQAVLTRSQWSHKAPQALPPLRAEVPVVSAAINDILILIVRDFVLVWYKEISTSPSFPTAVSSTLHSSMDRLLEKASTLDLSALVVKRILPKVTAHIEQFRQSEVALRGAGLERKLTQSEELDLLLASRYAARGGGKLHPAVENLSSTFTKQSEESHLRELVDKALPHILPEKEARSRTVKIVVREIVACSVLYPIMEMLADPDFWNRTIDQVAGAAIRQQRLISKVRNVLEAQLPRSHPQLEGAHTTATETITMRTDTKQFESFLRSISRCSSLLDARRLRNDIMGEIRRTRALLANNANSDWINGEKTEDVVAFLDRLYTAKRKVEKRIVVLGGEADSRQTIFQDAPTTAPLTLRDVLVNPSSLSYFMEFMDRRQRSLLVQFWLTVESFKNPLESVDSGSSDEDDEPLLDSVQSTTLKEDISLINELYFSSPVPDPVLSAVSQKHVTTIRSFGQSAETSTPASERHVRRSVMLAQRQIEREMEQDFEDFQRSELWFRAIADIQVNGGRTVEEGAGNRSPTSTRQSSEAVYLSRPSRGGSHPLLTTTRPVAPRSESSPAISGPSSRESPSPAGGAAHRPAVSNLQVLMSPVHDSPSAAASRAPLFDDPEDAEQQEQSQRMEAIQAALTDIIALDKQHEEPLRAGSSSDSISVQDSVILPTSTWSPHEGKRRMVFDDDVEEEGHRLLEEEDAEKQHGSFQLAGPGDLQLSHEIERLSNKITKSQTQDAMLDTLIKKAELSGDAQELRLLRKSKSALTRELRELRFQKSQYEQQESANRLLSDRTRVAIVNSTTGDEDGKQVVRYLVEVQQLAQDGSFSSGWVVARRYNEFFNMHNKLREKYVLVRNLDFPGKRLVTALSASFVDSRRIALEKYLQSLIAIPAICESEELRAFLSRDSPFMAAESSPASKSPTSVSAFPGQGLVRSMYQSVAESIDDMFFGPSMLDVIIQRLTTQAAEFVGITGTAIHDEDLVAQALRASGKSTSEDALMHLSSDLKPLEGETSTSTFSSPICDFILAVFELDKKNNWLRRQAIVIILQQVLGTTIEWKLRETVKSFLDEPHLMTFINIFRDNLWPSGNLKPPSVPRTVEEKLHTRDEANRKLSALMPDLAANMIGRSNARRGARRIFAVLQNRRLNQHLVYTIVDEVFSALFSETQ